MARCSCALTPCRNKCPPGQPICDFCMNHCIRELARRRARCRIWLTMLGAAGVTSLAWFVGWALRIYFTGR